MYSNEVKQLITLIKDIKQDAINDTTSSAIDQATAQLAAYNALLVKLERDMEYETEAKSAA